MLLCWALLVPFSALASWACFGKGYPCTFVHGTFLAVLCFSVFSSVKDLQHNDDEERTRSGSAWGWLGGCRTSSLRLC